MAQAGQAAWQCLLQHWPQAQRIGVVVGAGNNGGDGLVLARHARKAGRAVTVIALPGKPPATSLAQRAASEFTSDGGTITDSTAGCPRPISGLMPCSVWASTVRRKVWRRR